MKHFINYYAVYTHFMSLENTSPIIKFLKSSIYVYMQLLQQNQANYI
jgi:hypothetical protein